MAQTRLLIVGDDPLARAGLAGVLAIEPSFVVVTQVAAQDDVVGLARAQHADEVLWDFGAVPPSSNGMGLLRDLDDAGVPTLALVSGSEAGAEALRGGARGVMFRDGDPMHLVAAVRAVASGLTVMDSSMVGAALPARTATQSTAVDALTPRELEVLGLLSEGLSNKAIATRLRISEHTAKFHVNSILAKLGVEGRTEAVVRAAKMGLVVL